MFEPGMSRAGTLVPRPGCAAGVLRQLRWAASECATAACAAFPNAASAVCEPSADGAPALVSIAFGPPKMAAANRPSTCAHIRELKSVHNRKALQADLEKGGSGRWGNRPLGASGVMEVQKLKALASSPKRLCR